MKFSELRKKYRKLRNLAKTYWFDYKNDIKFTTVLSGTHVSKEALLASCAVSAHTIEKGLTMPEKRFNFGATKIKEICQKLFYCAEHFDAEGDRFEDIVGILKEYAKWHRDNNQELTDKDVASALQLIEERFPQINPVNQIYGISKNEYFAHSSSNFKDFAHSRHSCRNLSGKISDENLKAALLLANETVPSTCNRQSVRIHILNSKAILDIQKGNRGFGHLADKYLLLTSKLNHWPSNQQRNAPYVDGGIYLMNLLYALHYYGIAGCTLNMYLNETGTKRMHKELCIPEDETPIVLIAIGTPPEQFDLARSTRRNIEEIVTYHN